MLPTMYQYGILVATLFVLALAKEPEPLPQDHLETAPPSTAVAPIPNGAGGIKTSKELMEYCFFGRIPSATCLFICHARRMEAHCDEDTKKCHCIEAIHDEEEEEESQDIFDTPDHYQGLFKHPNKDGSTQTGEESEESDSNGAPHFGISVHPATTGVPTEDQENKHHVVFYIFDLNKIFGHSETEQPPDETTAQGAQVDKEESAGDKTPAPAGWSFQHIVALLIIVLLLFLIGLELFTCYKKQNNKNNMETIFKTMPMPNKA